MRFIFIILIVGFSGRAMAQFNPEKALYVQKFEKYKKMRSAGTLMIVGGCLFTVIGISKISNATYTTNAYGQQTTTDPNAVTGTLLTFAGISLVGGGIPLSIVGKHQMRKYQQKLDAITFKFDIAPQRHGLVLSYKF